MMALIPMRPRGLGMGICRGYCLWKKCAQVAYPYIAHVRVSVGIREDSVGIRRFLLFSSFQEDRFRVACFTGTSISLKCSVVLIVVYFNFMRV